MIRHSDIPSILVVEAERENRRLLRISLEKCGFRILLASSADEGIARCSTSTADLIIFDIDDVQGDAFTVLDHLHSSVKCPLIVLSSREREQDIVRSLDSGADDYIVKPFRTAELVARSRVALRRWTRPEEAVTFTVGSLTVDFRRREVWKANVRVQLTPTEYSLLALFIKNSGKVLTHRYILEQIWGASCTEDIDYLRVYVGHLRKKLEDDPNHPAYILTASRIGYGWSEKSPSRKTD